MSAMTEAFADPVVRRVEAAADPDSDSGPALRAMAALSVTLGRVASALQAEQNRKQLLAAKLRFAPIQPIVQNVAGGAVLMSNAEIWGPKTGYFWAVQRVSAAGLSPGGDTQSVQATTSPTTTFQTIASAGGLTPGALYTVTVVTTTGGTTGAPEINNFRVSGVSGAPSVILNSGPGVSDTNGPLTIQIGPAGTLVVTTGSNTPTTGATYTAEIDFTSQPDTLNLYRGQPQPQNFIRNLQFASPDWQPEKTGLILQPGDFLTAQGTGLVGTPVAVSFDVIIGRLAALSDFLMSG
jgi:hypothetical protein